MAIEKYTTEGIIIESFEQREHDRVFRIFTREFGMLFVSAKSIRKLESKLRAHMLPRTVSTITIVHGKEVWRLVGSEQTLGTVPYMDEATTLLKRFVKGEGTHARLYDRIIELLKDAPKYEERVVKALLYYIVFLDLGYADTKVLGIKDMKEYTSWSIEDLFTHAILSYDALRNHIHLVLKESQL